ncbi:MAG: hypothetical protein ACI9IA_000723 [Enterobacterales bacterium]|jgi:hypothetical protein
MGMEKSMYEPPQEGNPHKITRKQHIHTAYCISMFESGGYVQLKDISSGDILKRKKRAAIFCAERVWDERAENGYMSGIEKDFHKEVDSAQLGSTRNNLAISSYHLLWFLRHHFSKSLIPDMQLSGVSGSGINKDQSEIFEKKWGGHVRNDGVMPSRFVASTKIQQLIDMNISEYSNIHWGLLSASEGEFLVADCYQDKCFMPISPKLAFCAQVDDAVIDQEHLKKINNESVSKADNYYFGRDLDKCYL